MAGTRSSSRLSADTSPQQSETNKRKAEDSPSSKSKKGKTAGTQQTLEETVKKDDNQQDTENAPQAAQEEHATNGAAKGEEASNGEGQDGQNGESKDDPEKALKESRDATGLNSVDDKTDERTENAKDVPHDDVHATQGQQPAPTESNGGAIEEDKDREDAQPSNILEKGIIYFFTRGRVGIDSLDSVTDIQRSFFVLRPLPDGAKIGSGAMDDLKNNRLIAVPKKVWPKSPKDRFMAFVESAQTTNKDLKENFFQGNEYTTATVGVRQTPPVTPIGEGVYAITSTGNRGESHLVYMLTVPQEPGQLQEDVGLGSKGSFLMSLKNPQVKGPANASLPQKPDYPQEFYDEFRNRSWMPAEPKHLDYANAQILLIGENIESKHALEPTKGDEQSSQKETPEEEIEKLEHEDEIRIKHLKGDDSIFEDLGISKKDYPDVKTTW